MPVEMIKICYSSNCVLLKLLEDKNGCELVHLQKTRAMKVSTNTYQSSKSKFKLMFKNSPVGLITHTFRLILIYILRHCYFSDYSLL